MQQILKDAAGPGTFFWLIGYLAGILLFFTPLKASIGWVMLVTFTPFTIVVTWWWFLQREGLTLRYYAEVGAAWALIAIVLDYLFIVLLFGAAGYYAPHVLLYYALMFLIPVGIGAYRGRADKAPAA
jgi:hypothetical protein